MDLIDKISFGCVGLAMQPTLNKANRVLETAFNEGITSFDTAPIYSQGYSEIILGKFIKNKREKVCVTTKFGLSNIGIPKLPVSLVLPLKFIKNRNKKHTYSKPNYQVVAHRLITLEQVKFDFYNSLKRLQTDYIDNYLIHEGTPSFLTDEAKLYLFELKSKGLIKKLGLGICHKNLEVINQNVLQSWDILQYESNNQLNINKIYTDFSNKLHNHHSILKHIQNYKNKDISDSEKAGFLLAENLIKYPNATVIFSSTKVENIKINLKNIAKFLNLIY